MSSLTRPVFGSLLFALASAGCVSVTEPSAAGAAAPAAPEIVRLRTHDGDVAILAGSGGRRVTLYGASGAPLVRNADVEELRASHPAVFELLTTSLASQGAYLDATLYPADTAAATGDAPPPR